MQNPRVYGAADVIEKENGILGLRNGEEKTKKPATNLAITALNTFNPTRIQSLKNTQTDQRGEPQLTHVIQHLIDGGRQVNAIESEPGDSFLGIGSPSAYWEALETSYRQSLAR